MTADAAIWAIIPAAGSGARMSSAVPKQYLPVRGKPVILHTLERICAHAHVRGVVVGIAMDDAHWPGVKNEITRLAKFQGAYQGGARRAETVLNGLNALADRAKDMDWAMVHDAVRPCVRHADIDLLIRAVTENTEGGLLAVPISDTVKRTDNAGRVEETVPRDGLWRALTPQMFRVGALRTALREALASGIEVTDEAAAMERVGIRPRVVAGQPDNIKVTVPGDIALAEFFLAQQERKQ